MSNLNLENGRMRLAGLPQGNQFDLYDKIPAKTNDFLDAMNGNFYVTVLSKAFFSSDNQDIIQNGIRAGVNKLSDGKYMVLNQNIDNLKIIMRSIFMKYSKNLQTNITKKIKKLNALLLDYSVKNVYSGAVSYKKYCYDQSIIARPLDRPENYDRNFKQLEKKPWI